MKILVLQIRIGKADFNNQGLTEFYDYEQNVCMPSVRNWASKCGYDYKLVTESTINPYFFNNKYSTYAGERLVRLCNVDYDFIVYIDSDVLVLSHSKKIDLKPGLSIAADPMSTHPIFEELFCCATKSYKDAIKKRYYNSGVLIVDNKTGKELQDFFLNKVKINEKDNLKFADQEIINQWIISNNYLINELDSKWNYLMLCHDNKQYMHLDEMHKFYTDREFKINPNKMNFLHFIGPSKKYFQYINYG